MMRSHRYLLASLLVIVTLIAGCSYPSPQSGPVASISPKPAEPVQELGGQKIYSIPLSRDKAVFLSTQTANRVAWSPDGTRLATISVTEASIQIWDPSSGRLMATLRDNTTPRPVAWSPDGTKLASGTETGVVRIWNVANRSVSANLTGHTVSVWAIAWSPDGSRLASGDSSGSEIVWNVATGRQLWRLDEPPGIPLFSWNPNGTQMASGGKDGVRIWNAANGSLLTTIKMGGEVAPNLSAAVLGVLVPRGFSQAVWSPDGTMVAAVSGSKTVFFWNLLNDSFLGSLNHSGDPTIHPIRSIAWSPDGTKLAVSDSISFLEIWNLSNLSRPGVVAKTGRESSSISWSPDGTKIAVKAGIGDIGIWGL